MVVVVVVVMVMVVVVVVVMVVVVVVVMVVGLVVVMGSVYPIHRHSPPRYKNIFRAFSKRSTLPSSQTQGPVVRDRTWDTAIRPYTRVCGLVTEHI